MANTTLNPSDKTANITLSGGNLTVGNTNSANGGVRAVDRQVLGKFYWEVACTTLGSPAGDAIGIAVQGVSLASGISSLAGTSGVIRSGTTYVDGVSQGISFGTIANGTVFCVALDCTARLVWYRLGAAGNWNMSASANPATGVGGISIVSFGNAIPIYPTVWAGNTADAITANFGDTAFTGAVPSGFTSGFPEPSPTVLLVHADGTNGSTTFTDASDSAHVLAAEFSATVSTTSPMFGTGSAAFTAGISARVSVDTVQDFWFRAKPFTVEAWAYFTSAPASTTRIVMGNFVGSSNLGWDFGMVTGALAFYYSTTGSDVLNVGAAYVPTTNTWIHLAADRDASNVLRVYANGVVIASATVASTFFNSTTQFFIGNDGNADRNFPGRIDEVRVTSGIARYGGAFTPPSAPFVPEPTIPTNALASQALAEHWLTTSPDARITQVMAEHWASVTPDNLQAVVTQVVLEHWASVASVSPAAGGPIVTMIH